MSLKPLLNNDKPEKSFIEKLAESVGLKNTDIPSLIGIPNIFNATNVVTSGVKTIHDDAMTIYRDTEENISEVGREIADTKNQIFSTFNYAVTLLFILFGGSVLLYGPEVFSVFVALYERVKANGVSFSFVL